MFELLTQHIRRCRTGAHLERIHDENRSLLEGDIFRHHAKGDENRLHQHVPEHLVGVPQRSGERLRVVVHLASQVQGTNEVVVVVAHGVGTEPVDTGVFTHEGIARKGRGKEVGEPLVEGAGVVDPGIQPPPRPVQGQPRCLGLHHAMAELVVDDVPVVGKIGRTGLPEDHGEVTVPAPIGVVEGYVAELVVRGVVRHEGGLLAVRIAGQSGEPQPIEPGPELVGVVVDRHLGEGVLGLHVVVGVRDVRRRIEEVPVGVGLSRGGGHALPDVGGRQTVDRPQGRPL